MASECRVEVAVDAQTCTDCLLFRKICAFQFQQTIARDIRDFASESGWRREPDLGRREPTIKPFFQVESSVRALRTSFFTRPSLYSLCFRGLAPAMAARAVLSILVASSGLPSISCSAVKLRQGVGAMPPSTIRQSRPRPPSPLKTTATLGNPKSHHFRLPYF